MTPAARIAAAIEILAGLAETRQPAERFLKAYFRTRRFAGSKDRQAIAERVYGIFRRRAHLAHRMGSDAPRALAIAALLAEGADPAALFTGGYGPAPLSADERARIAAVAGAPPPWVEGEYPSFLEGELTRAFGADLAPEMAAFAARAPVDLRVNTLKAARDAVLAALAADGVACAPTPYAPDGIRCAPGAPVAAHPLFASGAFEIQDEAAQIVARLCDARPGMTVLDLAAGAGGKSLALAAAMANRGRIVAGDVRVKALEVLRRRAARAGATIIAMQPWTGETLAAAALGGPFDRVLVDAPCSGSGTWRRQPELKWRLTPALLAETMALQARLIAQGAALVAPGGRLIYATCSILPCENQGQLVPLPPGFRILDAARLWGANPVPGLAVDFRATPRKSGMDGFYCAVLERD